MCTSSEGRNMKVGDGLFITSAYTLKTYLLFVHDQQVAKVQTFPIRQRNQGNSGKPRHTGYRSTLQVLYGLSEWILLISILNSFTDAVVLNIFKSLLILSRLIDMHYFNVRLHLQKQKSDRRLSHCFPCYPVLQE